MRCFMVEYREIVKGTFIERPNRFIAICQVAGKEIVTHVKNTGRCKELLIPGVTVYLNYVPSNTRKTDYDLISVLKENRLINIDSQVPNEIVEESLLTGKIQLPGVKGIIQTLKREVVYQNSKFDFYFETDKSEKGFIEVKGMTLEKNNQVSFPDAPTLRGLKHVNELIHAVKVGFYGCVCFIVQMEGVESATINRKMQPALQEAMENALKTGVNTIAYTCQVTPKTITINKSIPFKLN